MESDLTAHVQPAILLAAEMLTFDGLGASLRKSLWLCLESSAKFDIFSNSSNYNSFTLTSTPYPFTYPLNQTGH